MVVKNCELALRAIALNNAGILALDRVTCYHDRWPRAWIQGGCHAKIRTSGIGYNLAHRAAHLWGRATASDWVRAGRQYASFQEVHHWPGYAISSILGAA